VLIFCMKGIENFVIDLLELCISRRTSCSSVSRDIRCQETCFTFTKFFCLNALYQVGVGPLEADAQCQDLTLLLTEFLFHYFLPPVHAQGVK
jgi:hypothetical protein